MHRSIDIRSTNLRVLKAAKSLLVKHAFNKKKVSLAASKPAIDPNLRPQTLENYCTRATKMCHCGSVDHDIA